MMHKHSLSGFQKQTLEQALPSVCNHKSHVGDLLHLSDWTIWLNLAPHCHMVKWVQAALTLQICNDGTTTIASDRC